MYIITAGINHNLQWIFDDLAKKMMERCYAPCLFLLAVLFIVSSSAADSNGSDRRNLLSNGLGLTPPMGYSLPLLFFPSHSLSRCKYINFICIPFAISRFLSKLRLIRLL